MSASHYSKTLLFIYLLLIFIFKFLKTTVQQKETDKQTKTERKNTHMGRVTKRKEKGINVSISGVQKGP